MSQNKQIKIGNFSVSNDLPFTLIAGPCVLESKDHAFFMCEALKKVTDKLGINLIYKSSFDKANRTSLNGVRGAGLENALPIFQAIKDEFNVPVITDVHSPEQCAIVAEVVDVLQIPAFLCRQTDLLIAAAETGKAINVKKGQFLAPWDMKNVADKLAASGNENIMLCERGASFGYNTLVTDFRGLPVMASTGYPVVFDATHSVQQPGGQGASSGGDRRFAPILARAAMAVGVAAVFMETHQDPDNAPSDGPNMIRIENMESILRVMQQLDQISKANPVSLAS